MDQNRISQQAIAILTTALTCHTNHDVDVQMGPLISEMMISHINIRTEANPEDVVRIAHASSTAVTKNAVPLVATLARAFKYLAEAHDAESPARSSTEILREFALTLVADR